MRTCLKCDYTRSAGDPPPLTGCPKCGAVYAKLEALAAAGAQIRPAVSPTLPPPIERAEAPRPPPALPPPPPASPSNGRHGDAEPFIDRLRRESLYLNFRGVNNVVFGIAVLIGVLLIISSMIALFRGDTVAGFGGLFAGIFMIVFFRAAKEGALMIADLSDAAVRMAERQEGQSQKVALLASTANH